MKKHFKVLEYMLIVVLLLYVIVYLFSYSTDNYDQDDIELGFHLVRVSLGHGLALIAISYLALKVKKNSISLALTVINGVIAWLLIGFSDFNVKAVIFGENYKYAFGNTLIKLGYVKEDVKRSGLKDMTSVTKCNIAEIMCMIIQVAIVIIVLYSIFVLILMFTKYAKKKIETKREYEKGIYTSVLRNVNLLLGVIFIGIMIYIVRDFYNIYNNKEAFSDAMINTFSAYLIPAIFLFIITDRWIKNNEIIKLIIFYVIYGYWTYMGISDFLVGAHYVTLAWIYVALVGITTILAIIKKIYFIHR